jgi:hypothetical protein
MIKCILIIIISSLLISCFENRSTFDKNERIEKLGIPIKIEYFKHIQDKAFQYSDSAIFIINDRQELITVIDEIKNADNPEPWKGAGWDRIKIYYVDTILNINTNNHKIGISNSGLFYNLNKENFITKRIHKK